MKISIKCQMCGEVLTRTYLVMYKNAKEILWYDYADHIKDKHFDTYTEEDKE
jgi:hypothetical protein